MNKYHDDSKWQLLSEAAQFAFTAHANQMRKGTSVPYIQHLMSVSALVLEYGGDIEQAVAGLLHDTVEDCGNHYIEEIERHFGARVLRLVLGCTDTDTNAAPGTPKAPWRQRKETYIVHLAHADKDVLLISACDKLHNARGIVGDLRHDGIAVFDRFKDGQEGTLWYYDAITTQFENLMPSRLSTDLRIEVDYMHQLATARL